MTQNKQKQIVVDERSKDKHRLMLFTLGAALFFIGGGALQFSDQYLTTSWLQELVALIALVVMIAGAMIAAYFYVVLAVVRIKRIVTSDP